MKKWEKIFWVIKRGNAIRGLQIETSFRDYKSRLEGLKLGADLGISNRGKNITIQNRDFKSGQRHFKSGQRLQVGARGISNWGRDYKSVQNTFFPPPASCLLH